MVRFWWRGSRGYRLRPWKSPYLRWRMETFWGIAANEIGFAVFWTLLWRNRRDIRRYLLWVERNS